MSNLVMSSGSLTGNDVRNPQGENLGDVKDFMINTGTGRVEYAVVSFGGFLGIGDKLFAVPMEALELDTNDKCFRMDADKSKLENAPGFDQDHWPNMADPTFAKEVHSYYGTIPRAA